MGQWVSSYIPTASDRLSWPPEHVLRLDEAPILQPLQAGDNPPPHEKCLSDDLS